MNSETIKPGSEDVVIEMANVQPSEDAVDGPKRQQNIASFYHTKKSAAEGMMDISLLTANANQLKFIIYYNQESKTFYAALAMIALSLALQVSIGFLLIFRVSFVFTSFVHDSIPIQFPAPIQIARSKAPSEHSERVSGDVDFSRDDYQHHGRSFNHNRNSVRSEIIVGELLSARIKKKC